MNIETILNSLDINTLDELKLKAISLVAPGTENYIFHLNYTLNKLIQDYYINKIREMGL